MSVALIPEPEQEKVSLLTEITKCFTNNIANNYEKELKFINVNFNDFNTFEKNMTLETKTKTRIGTEMPVEKYVNIIYKDNKRLTIHGDKNIKSCYMRIDRKNVDTESYMTKTRISSEKFENFNLRFNVSNETKENLIESVNLNENITMYRYIMRKTYMFEFFKIDMSVIKETNQNASGSCGNLSNELKNINEKYEIEMEFINSKTTVAPQLIYNFIYKYILCFQNSTDIISNNATLLIRNIISKMITANEIDKNKPKTFSNGRNKKLLFSDDFYMCEKTDGLHSYLYINDSNKNFCVDTMGQIVISHKYLEN